MQMCSDISISVNKVSKCFRTYQNPQDRLKQALFGRKKTYFQEFWALKNISLQVKRGETIGIIGLNGSGKSTLLQIIAGTLKPTSGSVEVNGRVTALLELGSGFNPEFTGRENIFLNGAILGLSREEMEQHFEDIVNFADIGDFIDQPVKVYSTGMMVRLAFAVQAIVPKEILIVDEALSVGDAKFQHKCINYIHKLREQGVTILFVSHDMEAVKRICNYSYVLEKGEFIFHGEPSHVVNWYLAHVSSGVQVTTEVDNVTDKNKKESDMKSKEKKFRSFRHGDGNAKILNVSLINEENQKVKTIRLGSRNKISCLAEVYCDLPESIVGFYIRDRLGTDILGTNTFQEGVIIPPLKAGDKVLVEFEFPVPLRPGHYSVTCAIAYNQWEQRYLDWIDNVLVFQVVDTRPGKVVFGLVDPGFDVAVKPLNTLNVKDDGRYVMVHKI